MTIGKNEATLELIFPEVRRERVAVLANVEVILFTGNLPYAIKLQRTCLRWCLNYSWQLFDRKKQVDHEDFDVAVIDCDLGFETALKISQVIYEQEQSLPILLVGSVAKGFQSHQWSPNVTGFVLKSLGTEKVVEYLISIGNDLHKKQ
ncbi:hypothetical protein [Pseudobacteriovorax antillogorgiicola]|uniref:Uncharacterized protein n=1 Tax=Pseudobacteriovorax antillogorgiicola TaxID=1513793 RepID=A0A1Y6B8A7_9BACT|nr:hypothetical protein [Pseudobacteriovorax antillogorgiicola]TCS58514.1 hypothetical protein EDD56_10227 [Pseudobacteriovorax antillogorgiicola]SME98087.1 hypothetical protein SAMN06296036_102416 [Pseudobacteriovorax antillogorgiicola]